MIMTYLHRGLPSKIAYSHLNHVGYTRHVLIEENSKRSELVLKTRKVIKNKESLRKLSQIKKPMETC